MPSPPLADARPARLLTRPFVQLCVVALFGAHAPNLFLVAPRFLRGLGFDAAHIGAIMGAFSLASLSAMPIMAHVADRAGRRVPVAAGLAVVACGCALFGFATTWPMFAAARALQGVGWAGVLVGSSIYATELAPPGRLAQALGIAGVLTLVALAAGPSFGELIAGHAGYPWVFRAATIMAIAGAAIALGLPGGKPHRHDDEAPRPRVWRPGTRGPLVATVLIGAGYGAIVAFLSDYAGRRNLGGVAPFFDAYVFLAIFARLTCGTLSDRLGRHPVLIPALAGQAITLVALAWLGATWQLWVIGALFGFTHGLYYPALQALIVDRAPPPAKAGAIASANFAFAAGMAVSAFGNGLVAKLAGYPAVYADVGGLALVAMVLVVLDREPAPAPAPG